MSQPNPQAEFEDCIIEFLLDKKKEYKKQNLIPTLDLLISDLINCEHQCSGNCRRVGCNCKCGEFHEIFD